MEDRDGVVLFDNTRWKEIGMACETMLPCPSVRVDFFTGERDR